MEWCNWTNHNLNTIGLKHKRRLKYIQSIAKTATKMFCWFWNIQTTTSIFFVIIRLESFLAFNLLFKNIQLLIFYLNYFNTLIWLKDMFIAFLSSKMIRFFANITHRKLLYSILIYDYCIYYVVNFPVPPAQNLSPESKVWMLVKRSLLLSILFLPFLLQSLFLHPRAFSTRVFLTWRKKRKMKA